MTPFLSVVIPAYNCEALIGECLDSILAQTMPDFEAVVVDDGSSDGTAEVIRRYAAADPRVRMIRQENGGVSRARNTGIREARGTVLGFADADDVLEPDTFQKVSAPFRDPSVDAVICGYYEETDDGKSVPHALEKREDTDGKRAAALFYEIYFTAVWNKYFRRDRIPEGPEGEFPPGIRIGEDEIWLAGLLKRLERWVFLPDLCYHWRFVESSAVRRGKRYEGKSFEEAEKLSSLYARRRMMELSGPFDAQVQALLREKHFRICFDIMAAAYFIGNRELYRECRKRISIGRKEYFRSPKPSRKGKLKILAMDLGMRLGVSKTILLKIDSLGQHHMDFLGEGKHKKVNV